MVTIKEVKTKKEIKDFIEFPLNLYKGNPYYVPELYGDLKKLFNSKNIYNDQCDSVYYVAYRDGKPVGRIHGIIQKVSNEIRNEKRTRFTRFDVIDDQEVSDALFEAVEKWGKAQGMTEIVGPLGMSDLEREGLLIEGFDKIATFEEAYNYEYYKKLIENHGFVKEVDWVERQLRASKDAEKEIERITRISQYMLEKLGLHIVKATNINKFIKKYADDLFDVLDITYKDIYGTVPFTDAMKKSMIANFKLIIKPEFVSVICDKNDKIVCFGLGFPSIGEPIQKSGGRLYPHTIVKLLHRINHPKVLDLGLIGVLPEYKMKGVSSALIAEIHRYLSSGIEYAETNLNLETNDHIQNQWKTFDAVLHKRRRCFVKQI